MMTTKGGDDSPPTSTSFASAKLEFTHSSSYIAGRYIKLNDISQTPWLSEEADS
jgi:tRNA U54 and U55 pseudouridine synthase Pus10